MERKTNSDQIGVIQRYSNRQKKAKVSNIGAITLHNVLEKISRHKKQNGEIVYFLTEEWRDGTNWVRDLSVEAEGKNREQSTWFVYFAFSVKKIIFFNELWKNLNDIVEKVTAFPTELGMINNIQNEEIPTMLRPPHLSTICLIPVVRRCSIQALTHVCWKTTTKLC